MQRIEQYLDLMLHVLRADGVVDPAEREKFMAIMVEGLQLRPELVERYRKALECSDWTEVSDDELAALGEGLEPGSIAHMVKDAYAMAEADGNFDVSELVLVRRFLKAIGIPETRMEAIDNWARVSLEVARKGERLFVRVPQEAR
ncbi:MAG: TerB family tellurite resistance protein [Vulcanimicrobiota bacterium]